MSGAVTLGGLAASGVIAIGDGYRTRRDEHGRPGYRILRVADVLDGRIEPDGPDFVSERRRRNIGSKLSETGDVVVTTKGTVGRVSIIPELNQPLVYSPQLCYFRVLEPDILNGRYLSYWFRSAEFRAQASHRKDNTDMAAYINLADIKSMELLLPPATRQRAVVEVLGALDDKIAANDREGELALELADSIYRQRSAGWSTLPLSDVLVSVLGGTPPRANAAYWGGDVPWASARDVAAAPQGVIVETAESITGEAARATKARPLPAGTTILTARGTVGAVARLGTAAAFNQSCYAFEPGRLPPGVLYFAIKGVARQARALAHGSVFDTITRSTFKHTLVPLPDAPGVNDAESRIQPLLDVSQATVLENLALGATRDALLQPLMTGKVRVEDAEKIAEEAL